MSYRCIRVLNNSVVLAEKVSTGAEVILLGKGIGVEVGKDKHKLIAKERIQRLYELKDTQENDYLKELIKSVSTEVITITLEIMKKAERMLKTKFRTNLYFTILDHLSFAIERNKEGLENSYYYLEEMKLLLKEEFDVCQILVDYINCKLNVNLAYDEAVLLAIHFANARTDNHQSDEKIIKEIMEILALKLAVDLEKSQTNLHRLKTHLRLFLKTNATRKGQLKPSSYQEFEQLLAKDYQKELDCARLIVEFLKKKYQLTISRDEIIYLTMHIIPIVTKN